MVEDLGLSAVEAYAYAELATFAERPEWNGVEVDSHTVGIDLG